jgi:hypothetical protein
MSCPPGRSSRAASGIPRYGSHQILAPYSEIARSKLPSAAGTVSALPCQSGPPRVTVRSTTAFYLSPSSDGPKPLGIGTVRRTHEPARLQTGAARLDCSVAHARARLRHHETPANGRRRGCCAPEVADGDKCKPLDLARLLSEVQIGVIRIARVHRGGLRGQLGSHRVDELHRGGGQARLGAELLDERATPRESASSCSSHPPRSMPS